MTRQLAAIAVAFLTAASLFALAGYQVTTEAPATRLLGRLGAALVELDRWLPAHRDDLDLLARDRPGAIVPVKDLPVSASVPAETVLNPDDTALERAIVHSMGQALYREGTGALRDSEGKPQTPPLTDPMRWSVALLETDAHHFWEAALPLFALLLVAAVAGGLLFGVQPLTPMAIGSVTAALLSAGVWLLTGLSEDASSAPVDREALLAMHDGAWIGLRNAAAVAVAVIGIRVLAGSLTRDRSPRGFDDWDYEEREADPDYRRL